MQTSVVLNDRLVLTDEAAQSVGLHDGDRAQLKVAGGQLLVEPAPDGVPARQLRLPLSEGLMASLGWQNGHVVTMETREEALAVKLLGDPMDPALTSIGDDGVPVPPQWLIHLVTGRPQLGGFVARGHKVASLFAELIQRHLPDTERPTVMDFGCGCGRLARALPQHLPCEMYGYDITAAAVEWCRRNLPGTYLMSSELPPLPLEDASFDVLYAVSVFTHLDEAHQDPWLAEWRRLVRPGGLLLVTYRGEGFFDAGRMPERREEVERLWEEASFAFIDTDLWRGAFPGYYGGSFQQDEYVREHWGHFFDVIAQRPTERPMLQDLAVLRRP
jgi:SAM-dependent methyltransferase